MNVNNEEIRPFITNTNTGSHQKSLADFKMSPIILDAKQSIHEEIIHYHSDDSIEIQLDESKSIKLEAHQIFNMVVPTMFGLNESLVKSEEGGLLRQDFENEYNLFNSMYDRDGNIQKYGNYVYYPDCQNVVQFAPAYWHQMSLLASNAQLIKDPDFNLSWTQIREVFFHSAPAVAGASVGSKIADTILKTLRPQLLTIADPAVYKLTNANRTDISYEDIVYSMGTQKELETMGEFSPFGMKNKAISFAIKSQKIDPYIKIYPFSEGVNLNNLHDFVSGAGFVIEEIDLSFDSEMKVAIRSEARNQQKMILMVSDLGSWVQWDIRPFHLNQNISLFLDCTDEKIFSLNKEAKHSKDNFFNFMDGLIGNYYREAGEFGATLSGRLPKIVGSMPQLGSTTSMAGGLAAELSARILLGHKDIYERGIIDLRNQEIRLYGRQIGEL